MSISGDTAIVGARLEDPGGVSDAGSAYFFQRDEGGANSWGLVSQVTASDGSASDSFGIAVSISGDTAIVGANHDGLGVNLDGAGSAYVFVRDQAGDWLETKKLTASDPAQSDGFGSSVSIDGDIAVAGSPGDDATIDFDDEGSAYLFKRNHGGANSWGQLEKLTVSVPPASDTNFGADASSSGNTIVIGAPRFDHHDLLNPGAAFVFVPSPPAVPSLSPAAAAVAAWLVLLAGALALGSTV